MTAGFDFFYDAQIRRVLLQFMRIFSLLKVQSAPDENGAITESSVIVRYGDLNRLTASILRNNSENSIVPATMIAVTIKDIEKDDSRRMSPHFVSSVSVDERELGQDGKYTGNIGKSYTVERYMPVPYNITFQADVWTTNTTTKLQILEQILSIFNPSVSIQTTDNPLDWTMMMEVELTGITWSNRSIPQGTDSDRDVSSLTFKVPAWISPPAKVKTKKLIDTVVSSIYAFNQEQLQDLNSIDKFVLDPMTNCFDEIARTITTPSNLSIQLGIGELNSNEVMLVDSSGAPAVWGNVPGFSESAPYTLLLKTASEFEDQSGDVYGTLTASSNSAIGTFEVNIDTLPVETAISPVSQIIDPLKKYPGKGLPAAAAGQRYLLLNGITVNTGANPWGSVNAKENDIIEYNGVNWQIIFGAENANGTFTIASLGSNQYYTFNNGEWKHSFFGEYSPGYWKLIK